MQQGFTVDGATGLLLLSIPILFVVLAAIWATRQSRTPHPPTATAPQAASEGTTEMQPAPTPAPSGSSDLAEQPIAPPPAVARVTTVAPAPAAEVATPVVPPLAGPSIEDLAAEISRSEANGNSAELAHLYIKQAAAYVASGLKDEGASRLRDAIRVAALNRLAEPHALARLELGDLYFGNGDPTTACEQWQIARNLFHDLARPADRDATDKRMLSNGCPTDWVLTDF